jgi:hypothetical protein
MPGFPVKVDHGGFAELLKSAEMQQVVRETADAVADNVRGQGLTVSGGGPLPVDVDTYTTDRAAAAVTITHPAGLGMQAKYGALTKAAAAAGLEVTEK